jgi:transcriptional regulator with XRE-family HTH domain
MDQTLGVWLREAREAKGSSLEDMATATRIRPRFLTMMEDGNFAAFPGGELQIRGFLRIVARYLELSADEVLARYDAEFHAPEPDESELRKAELEEAALRKAERAAPLGLAAAPELDSPSVAWRPLSLLLSPSGERRGIVVTGLIWSAVLIVMIGIGASIAYVVTQGGVGRSRASAAMPTPTLTQLATAPQDAPQPVAPPTVAPSVQSGVTVVLEAMEHVWVRVTADGQIAYVGLLAPDEVRSWSANEGILVETGNGAGLLVTVNDRLVGPFGARGEASSRAWGPTGETEPT